MPHPALPLALLALTAPALASAGEPVMLAQYTVRQRVVIRVPRVPSAPASAPVEWREKKGPKCVPATALAGALVSERNKLDLVLRGGRRIRAELDDNCHRLDYYRGFYLKPSADGMVCADRDEVRSRSGARCPIDRFRLLVPKR